MEKGLLITIIIVIVLASGFGIYYSIKQGADSANCANEGENVYDMTSKGPVKCCEGLILQPCTGVCTPSIPGKCVKA